MQALKGFNLPVILVFATGCACGLLLFSQILAWLFRHKRHATLVFLTGVLAGSLYNLWPWQLTALDKALVLVSPATYAEATGESGQTIICALLTLAGFVLVLGLENLGSNSRTGS
jgi:putative membrane protein